MSSNVLVASSLSKAFGRHTILENLSFTLPEGASLAIIGPSGCGKSTLLSILAGLTKADSGTISMPETWKKAFILQEYGLFPWKSVLGNIVLPLQLRGIKKTERLNAAASIMKELGLEGLERRFPIQLSGGQRQRVAIGRALISNPDLLLMDEPFAALDAITREHLQNILLSVWQRRRMSFILVTHNVSEAAFLGKYIMVMGGHPSTNICWIDNPCFGDSSCRSSSTYFSLMQKVHKALEQTEQASLQEHCLP